MDSQVIEFLQSKQISVIQEDINTKLKVWESWYKGHVDGFHLHSVHKRLTRVRDGERKAHKARY